MDLQCQPDYKVHCGMHFGLFLESVLLFIAFAVPRYFNHCICALCFNTWKNQFLERIFSIFKWGRESADREVTDTTGEAWDLDGGYLKRQGNGFLSPSKELILTRRKDTPDTVRRRRMEGCQRAPSPSRGNHLSLCSWCRWQSQAATSCVHPNHFKLNQEDSSKALFQKLTVSLWNDVMWRALFNHRPPNPVRISSVLVCLTVTF